MATEEQTTVNTNLEIGDTDSRAGQRLTVTNRIISKLSFKIYKFGAPTGNVSFVIRKVSDDSVIISKVWGDGTLLGVSELWKEVTFDTATYVNEEVYLLCEYSSGDNNNNVRIKLQASDVKASEYTIRYVDLDSDYTEHSTYDTGYIYTYATPTTTPTVTAQAVTSIVTTTATGNGNVTSLGDSPVTQHGHCWNTTGTPDTDDSKTINGAKATTGAFTSAMTSLTAGTKYYVRAYATNVAGTSYSNQVEFTAGKGTVFPINPLLRASGIRRTFWSGLGGLAVYQCELALGGMTTAYVSPIGSRDIPSATTPARAVTTTPLPSGIGAQETAYLEWLKQTDIQDILKLFGHFPTYTDWVTWKQAPYFPKYF